MGTIGLWKGNTVWKWVFLYKTIRVKSSPVWIVLNWLLLYHTKISLIIRQSQEISTTIARSGIWTRSKNDKKGAVHKYEVFIKKGATVERCMPQ